jgi:all-trans-retinol dehydrogenase (NAD+)
MSSLENLKTKIKEILAQHILKDGIKGASKKIGILLIALYAFYAFLKTKGWLPKKSVKGEHVFITGGGSGIGRQMAKRFARLGAKISIADLNFNGAKNVEREIIEAGGLALAIELDVADPQKVKIAASAAVAKFGDVTILINNAGIVTGKKILQATEAQIQKTIAINTTSHSYTVREFLPAMLSNNKGHIVTIASVAGLIGVCGLTDYCASKFGAYGFDESLRMELNNINKNIKTTCICPYYINTGMFDGVKSKFGFVLPILEENWASQRIVNAILQEEKVTVLPWFCNIVMIFKAILPVGVNDWLCDFMGANSSMDHFKGRSG